MGAGGESLCEKRGGRRRETSLLSRTRTLRVLKALGLLFLNVEKIIPSKQANDENKGSTPGDTFFPVYPHQPNPHVPPPERMAGLSSLEPAAGSPWQAPGGAVRVATVAARAQARPQGWMPPCSLLALPGRRMLLLLLHTSIHIPEPRKLSLPVQSQSPEPWACYIVIPQQEIAT